ncbi:HPr family phosphocarrier protein [Oribacterium sp. HCP28S3_H8]|jgi:phosphotransferase system HPr-like phosphotransfer protein|uniref:HPr family phosphocarrier protein n=1 Tax=Oribacterium sp. HCP28S3_H8 TaxID=3438945 RepID=UPI0030731CE5|nr:HPr family phosphocarrier protein [Oribacterium sp.]
MSTLNVMFSSVDAVRNFVAKVSNMPFDLNLGAGSRIVDAKSLVGVMYMGIGRVIPLHAPAEKENYVKSELAEYLV